MKKQGGKQTYYQQGWLQFEKSSNYCDSDL